MRRRHGISDARFGAVLAVVTLAFVVLGVGSSSLLSNQQRVIQTNQAQVRSQVTSLQRRLSSVLATQGANLNISSLPLVNQTTSVRTIWETWYLSPSAHEDRFSPAFITVNQGDTVQLTLIDNDTVAHDFVIGPPYNIVVNATVPGLVNDLTGQTFTSPSKNNSPGVVVTGSVGNVTARYSFVAKYAGVYEFVCTYHAQVGMIGYLVVLPNAAYGEKLPAGHQAAGQGAVTVSIVPGAGSNTTSKGYAPDTITLVRGVNDTVTWVNNDSAPHTVTANDGRFNSGNMAPGQTFSFTFTNPGTYDYHCVYHPWMTGTVIVK